MKISKIVVLFSLTFLLSASTIRADAGTGEPCQFDASGNPGVNCLKSEVCQNNVCIPYSQSNDYQATYVDPTAEEHGQALDACREGNSASLECFQKSMLGNIVLDANCALVQGPECGLKAPASANGGALGGLGKVITAMVVNPPASSVTYLADLGNNMGLVKPAYAQGIGFAGLNPILNVWKAFRNLAYIAFILIFVVYGFMIMFRVKIDPRTVVSFQIALPKIVVALILVTFSYAIVGLLIDLSYLLIFVSLSFFEASDLIETGGATQIQNIVFNQNIFRMIFNIFPHLVDSTSDAIGDIVQKVIGQGFLASLGGVATSGILKLILSIALIFVMFRVFLALLGAYVGIITDVIFSPIRLLLDVLPGQNGFAGWITGLLANILVFPATVFILTLAAVLIGSDSPNDNPWGVTNPGYATAGQGWVPPLLGMQGSGTNPVPSIIALGLLLMLPKVVDMIKETFGQKGPSPITGAVGEGLRPGVSFVSSFAGSLISGRLEEERQVRALRRVLPGAGQNIPMQHGG